MRICTAIFFSVLTLEKAFLVLGKPTTKEGTKLTKALKDDGSDKVKNISDKSQSSDTSVKLTDNQRYVTSDKDAEIYPLFLTENLVLRLPLPLRLRPIPGMDTTVMDTGRMATTGLMAMDTTMGRGLLILSPLLLLRLMPCMETMAMAFTDVMAMDTMDTGPMVITGERSKKHDSCQTAAN